MASFETGDRTMSYARITAAALCAILLFVPILLAGLPGFSRAAFPVPFVRADAILVFFVSVPLVFGLFAVYRVAQYHGLTSRREEE